MPRPSRERRRLAAQALKHGADVVVAAVALLVVSPVMIGCAVTIRIIDGGPVLFLQDRAGRGGRTFKLVKFRSMRPVAHGEDQWTSDATRLTAVGGVMRRYSLDELPQLFNVLAGDMSLVGPRPLLPEYLPLYPERYRVRHNVRPGVTGLAQVSGRRRLAFSARLELDREYVENWSLALDTRILIETLAEVFRDGPDATQSLADIDDLGFMARIAGLEGDMTCSQGS